MTSTDRAAGSTPPAGIAPAPANAPALTQDQLKEQVGRAALDYVVRGAIVGVGTGSTVNKFIEALATIRLDIKGGADEIDRQGFMVKGGGAALTREKIVAAQSRRFICIADASKLVDVLGAFPLPVEVIPMAARRIMRQFAAMGGIAQVRERGGVALVTDNGQHIVDVTGLGIVDPLAFESEVSQWPGVVTVGVFAHQKADVCLLGTDAGVQTLRFE